MNNKSIYFVGIGGIGMSALARYFMHEGYRVGGYDRTPNLTFIFEIIIRIFSYFFNNIHSFLFNPIKW